MLRLPNGAGLLFESQASPRCRPVILTVQKSTLKVGSLQYASPNEDYCSSSYRQENL